MLTVAGAPSDSGRPSPMGSPMAGSAPDAMAVASMRARVVPGRPLNNASTRCDFVGAIVAVLGAIERGDHAQLMEPLRAAVPAAALGVRRGSGSSLLPNIPRDDRAGHGDRHAWCRVHSARPSSACGRRRSLTSSSPVVIAVDGTSTGPVRSTAVRGREMWRDASGQAPVMLPTSTTGRGRSRQRRACARGGLLSATPDEHGLRGRDVPIALRAVSSGTTGLPKRLCPARRTSARTQGAGLAPDWKLD